MNLFDLIEPNHKAAPIGDDSWRPPEFPNLSAAKIININFEATGLRWFDRDKPISIAIGVEGKQWYLPWGHRGGGNLPEDNVRRWLIDTIRGKHLRNINTRFDCHMGRIWDVDFESLGCTVSDVAHYAALLDDHRLKSSLDHLIPEFLRQAPMSRLDESRMAEYSAGAAAPRAMYNVWAVEKLAEVMLPQITAQGLDKVRQLEEEVIFVVCEMEKNGTLIDQEKLAVWTKQTERLYHQQLLELHRLTGLRINPNSNPDQNKLFRQLGIESPERTKTGGFSYTEAVLKHIPHPTVKVLLKAKKYASLNSKLKKYQKSIDDNGILRFALHQLRASKSDAESSSETGTVVGRFTSTEIVDGFGVNIQQVLKPEKQFASYGDEFFIRELHVPSPGQLHLSVDAEQIQYRLFAHEANNPKINQAYQEDPFLSFHRMMHATLREFARQLTYKRTKDVNFAKIFAAGPKKLAWMLEFITKKQFEELTATKAKNSHPLLKETNEILKIYAREIPEVDELLRASSDMATSRGYVKSILGRRMRFPDGQRLHKALNGRIIMSEADIVKTKAVELHRNRKYTNFLLRFQVHDEFDGDVPDVDSAKRVEEVLNRQSFSLRIPILWKCNTGTSWGDCARDELQKLRREREEYLAEKKRLEDAKTV